ncbi:biotin-dependent carboxyltransferase family protein [Terrisporobacter mayombei]|uniref:5-oxoprolinase subunit C n=1 Tax=Terrisporobacter mayombei TaxID=1541 RepID=A0ABY9Q502_9FIRM|nr:biotin-dependent carboxyltransferase family protein [Terrisporobacter mayombei]MCC3867396.1 biotin-dependent carboxyltransferase family protein [Terrisporobacter mayombei]WMT81657.1 5-oxoprolinase subunit C [Terrisporobacter mayombei]
MGIEILQSGLYTSVQDFGRIGYQDAGFSVCGAMDKKSLSIGNLLVDNQEDEAGLEITLIGPKIKFTEENFISITGGDLNPKINGEKVSMYKALLVKKDDILSFTDSQIGARAYIAFCGGLKIDKVMGSKSTNVKCSLGGYKGRTLKDGDFIEFSWPKVYLENYLSRKLDLKLEEEKEIVLRVILGPQDDAFTENGIYTFLNEKYEVTKEFDRMGCRLDGPIIEHKTSADIISDGIVLGSIQVPSHGKPIIMLSDRQTTGGYTKIATVISLDIGKLAQRKTGDKIRFEEISLEKAQQIYRDKIKKMNEIKKQINRPCIEVLNPRNTSKKIEILLNSK